MTFQFADPVEMDTNKQVNSELVAKTKIVISVTWWYLGFKISNTAHQEVLCVKLTMQKHINKSVSAS